MLSKQISITIFLRLQDIVYSFQNNRKNLDPSYKMDLDLCDCLGRVRVGKKSLRN